MFRHGKATRLYPSKGSSLPPGTSRKACWVLAAALVLCCETIAPGPQQITLFLHVQGDGRGTVVGIENEGDQTAVQTLRITCRTEDESCSVTFTANDTEGFLSLTATANEDSEFIIWGQDCAEAGGTSKCSFVWDEDNRTMTFNASARFNLKRGSIEISTQTTGEGEYPAAYGVSMDSAPILSIGANERETVSDLLPGDYRIELTNVPANCTVAGSDTRDVTVEGNETTRVEFAVNCAPTISPTAIEVTAVTTGADFDLNGYRVKVEDQAQHWNASIGVNEAILITVPWGGDYQVELSNVASNCTLDTATLPNPRTVSVAPGDTAQTTFSLDCKTWATLHVANETTGWDLDPDGYTVTVGDLWPEAVMPNETVTFIDLLEGTYGITLSGVSPNCVVRPSDVKTVQLSWGDDHTSTFDVACSGIVVESNRDGFYELWVLSTDGAPPDRVFSSTHDNSTPAWSPDRTRLAYMSDKDGNPEIYVYDLFNRNPSNNPVRVTNDLGEDDDAVWSPDGQSILFTSDRNGNKDLFIKSAGGGGPVRQITSHSAGDDDADWARVDPLGGTAEWIVFTSSRDIHDDDELYLLDISQDPLGTPTQITFNDVKDDDAVFSPDGTKIAFARRTFGDNRDIFVMDFDRSNVVQLTTDLADDDDPTWSPDGTRIAFGSNRDGNEEIYVINADGSGLTRVTFHASDEDEPGWWR